MRHYRRTYASGARVKKIMFRILFVILAAAVITFGSILLGVYLQGRVNELNRNIAEPAMDQLTTRPDFGESAAAQREVSAFGLHLRDYRSEEAVIAAVQELAAHYDTILFDLSEDGALLYTSPALCKLMHIDTPEEDADLALVRTALTAAKDNGLTPSVLIDTSYGRMARGVDEAADGTLFAELASFGAEEILIRNAILDTSDPPASDIADYLHGCSVIVDGACALGVLFPEDLFLNFTNARDIQVIASAVEFTAIDMTAYGTVTPDELYERMRRDVSSLYGSFSIYNMRVILATASTELLAAQRQALLDGTITNICFTDPISPGELIYERPEDTLILPETEEETTEPRKQVQPETNPYAATGDTEDEDTVGGTGGWY